ncbi:MAG: hypothetical protein ACTHMB_17185, partial [Candidatus Binatia bacterium]
RTHWPPRKLKLESLRKIDSPLVFLLMRIRDAGFRLWFCSSNKNYSKANPTFPLGIFLVIGHLPNV